MEKWTFETCRSAHFSPSQERDLRERKQPSGAFYSFVLTLDPTFQFSCLIQKTLFWIYSTPSTQYPLTKNNADDASSSLLVELARLIELLCRQRLSRSPLAAKYHLKDRILKCISAKDLSVIQTIAAYSTCSEAEMEAVDTPQDFLDAMHAVLHPPKKKDNERRFSNPDPRTDAVMEKRNRGIGNHYFSSRKELSFKHLWIIAQAYGYTEETSADLGARLAMTAREWIKSEEHFSLSISKKCPHETKTIVQLKADPAGPVVDFDFHPPATRDLLEHGISFTRKFHEKFAYAKAVASNSPSSRGTLVSWLLAVKPDAPQDPADRLFFLCLSFISYTRILSLLNKVPLPPHTLSSVEVTSKGVLLSSAAEALKGSLKKYPKTYFSERRTIAQMPLPQSKEDELVTRHTRSATQPLESRSRTSSDSKYKLRNRSLSIPTINMILLEDVLVSYSAPSPPKTTEPSCDSIVDTLDNMSFPRSGQCSPSEGLAEVEPVIVAVETSVPELERAAEVVPSHSTDAADIPVPGLDIGEEDFGHVSKGPSFIRKMSHSEPAETVQQLLLLTGMANAPVHMTNISPSAEPTVFYDKTVIITNKAPVLEPAPPTVVMPNVNDTLPKVSTQKLPVVAASASLIEPANSRQYSREAMSFPPIERSRVSRPGPTVRILPSGAIPPPPYSDNIRKKRPPPTLTLVDTQTMKRSRGRPSTLSLLTSTLPRVTLIIPPSARSEKPGGEGLSSQSTSSSTSLDVQYSENLDFNMDVDSSLDISKGKSTSVNMELDCGVFSTDIFVARKEFLGDILPRKAFTSQDRQRLASLGSESQKRSSTIGSGSIAASVNSAGVIPESGLPPVHRALTLSSTNSAVSAVTSPSSFSPVASISILAPTEASPSLAHPAPAHSISGFPTPILSAPFMLPVQTPVPALAAIPVLKPVQASAPVPIPPSTMALVVKSTPGPAKSPFTAVSLVPVSRFVSSPKRPASSIQVPKPKPKPEFALAPTAKPTAASEPVSVLLESSSASSMVSKPATPVKTFKDEASAFRCVLMALMSKLPMDIQHQLMQVISNPTQKVVNTSVEYINKSLNDVLMHQVNISRLTKEKQDLEARVSILNQRIAVLEDEMVSQVVQERHSERNNLIKERLDRLAGLFDGAQEVLGQLRSI